MARRGASGRKKHRVPIICMSDHNGGRQLGAETRGGAYPGFYFSVHFLEQRTRVRRVTARVGPQHPAQRPNVPKSLKFRSMSGGGAFAAAVERGSYSS